MEESHQQSKGKQTDDSQKRPTMPTLTGRRRALAPGLFVAPRRVVPVGLTTAGERSNEISLERMEQGQGKKKTGNVGRGTTTRVVGVW